jgi:hypothetical protein
LLPRFSLPTTDHWLDSHLRTSNENPGIPAGDEEPLSLNRTFRFVYAWVPLIIRFRAHPDLFCCPDESWIKIGAVSLIALKGLFSLGSSAMLTDEAH